MVWDSIYYLYNSISWESWQGGRLEQAGEFGVCVCHSALLERVWRCGLSGPGLLSWFCLAVLTVWVGAYVSHHRFSYTQFLRRKLVPYRKYGSEIMFYVKINCNKLASVWRSLRRADHSFRGVLLNVVCSMKVIAKPRKRRPWPRTVSKSHKEEELAAVCLSIQI